MEAPLQTPYDPGDAYVVERITTYWSKNRTSTYRRMRREKTWDAFVRERGCSGTRSGPQAHCQR